MYQVWRKKISQQAWSKRHELWVKFLTMSFNDYLKGKVEADKKSKTVMEQERSLVKAKGAGGEYLDEVGQIDEDKAAEAVVKVQGEVDKVEAQAHEEAMEEMDKNRQTKLRYTIKLGEAFYKICQTIDWTDRFTWKIGLVGEEKINLTFKDRETGRGYGQGIIITGQSFYDLNALHILATRCENTVDKISGRMADKDHVKDSGIWVPGQNKIVN